jgi:serine/threonine-protein kinase
MDRTIGPYRLGDSLSATPFGELLAASHAARSEPLALLLLDERLTRDHRFRGLLRLEVARAGGLRKPAIARSVEVGEQAGAPYVVFERPPDGESLARRLAADAPPSPEAAVALVHRLAEGLDAAHGRRLVHGALGPSSVLVGSESDAALVGVGLLAAAEEAGLGAVVAGRSEATFAAPEQAAAQRAVPSADGYALGVLAEIVLTGRLSGEEPRSPLGDGLSDAVRAVLVRQRAAEPAARYPTCTAFATALTAAVADAPVTAAAVTSTPVPAAEVVAQPVVESPAGPTRPPAGPGRSSEGAPPSPAPSPPAVAPSTSAPVPSIPSEPSPEPEPEPVPVPVPASPARAGIAAEPPATPPRQTVPVAPPSAPAPPSVLPASPFDPARRSRAIRTDADARDGDRSPVQASVTTFKATPAMLACVERLQRRDLLGEAVLWLAHLVPALDRLLERVTVDGKLGPLPLGVASAGLLALLLFVARQPGLAAAAAMLVIALYVLSLVVTKMTASERGTLEAVGVFGPARVRRGTSGAPWAASELELGNGVTLSLGPAAHGWLARFGRPIAVERPSAVAAGTEQVIIEHELKRVAVTYLTTSRLLFDVRDADGAVLHRHPRYDGEPGDRIASAPEEASPADLAPPTWRRRGRGDSIVLPLPTQAQAALQAALKSAGRRMALYIGVPLLFVPIGFSSDFGAFAVVLMVGLFMVAGAPRTSSAP